MYVYLKDVVALGSELTHSGSPTTLKLTFWVSGTNPSTLDRNRARAHQNGEPNQTEREVADGLKEKTSLLALHAGECTVHNSMHTQYQCVLFLYLREDVALGFDIRRDRRQLHLPIKCF